MTIINDDSGVINKLKASLTDDARVVIYNRHMFIVQTTGLRSNVAQVDTKRNGQLPKSQPPKHQPVLWPTYQKVNWNDQKVDFLVGRSKC